MPDDARESHAAGVSNALAAGYALLQKGASAIDAVEAAVVVLEDDETFDAGRGSFLTSEGKVQLDALLMDGGSTGTLRAGGVACVERLLNPIHAARVVLDQSPPRLLRRPRCRSLRSRPRRSPRRQQRPGHRSRTSPARRSPAQRAGRPTRRNILRRSHLAEP